MSKTKHLVTLSDHNYVTNGLALYESLKAKSPDFILHYLCLNEQTYNKISSLNLPDLKCYNMEEFSQDKDFEILKKNNQSHPIDIRGRNWRTPTGEEAGHSPFHWALASFFSAHLVNTYNLPHVLYVDSDIIFYDSVDKIFDAMGSKSIGIITHKHVQLGKTSVGYYNVGIVYFRNDKIGNECLNFWKNCCVDTSNEYAPIFGSCGDQKYLELFDDLFGEENIEVLCKKVGNGAPWNFTMFEFLDNHRIIWRDPHGYVLNAGESLEQDLIFNHFSHFTCDYNSGGWRVDRFGEWGRGLPSHPGVSDIYQEYMTLLMSTREKYAL